MSDTVKIGVDLGSNDVTRITLMRASEGQWHVYARRANFETVAAFDVASSKELLLAYVADKIDQKGADQ